MNKQAYLSGEQDRSGGFSGGRIKKVHKYFGREKKVINFAAPKIIKGIE
jgi:hypothetical protein